ncbi:SRPBCC family protein [Bacteroidota bacterium]
MRTIRTDIVIQAERNKIWDILCDFPSYPDWNPFIKEISGELTPGARLSVTMQIEGRKPTSFRPEVISANPPEKFCWRGKLFVKGVFDGTHYFILEEMDGGVTKLIQGENFQGLFAGPILRQIEKATLKGFEGMNQALKEKAETTR